MSSVLFRGVEVPKSCSECPLCSDECFGSYRCSYVRGWGSEDSVAPDCIAVGIESPHGRMIDADALMRSFSYFEFSSDMGDAMEMLAAQPTVIEAEDMLMRQASGNEE